MTAFRILRTIATATCLCFASNVLASPADNLRPGMSTDEMLAVITAGMEAGVSCAETRAAITLAVELSNDAAPELVAGLVARQDTGCFDDSWLAQRVENRLLRSTESVTAIYMPKACVGPYSVVRSVVEGLEIPENSDPATVETLAASIAAVLEQANLALGGDTAAGNACVEAVLVAAIDGIANTELRNAVWAALPGQFEGTQPWDSESLAFLTSYDPYFALHLATRQLYTSTGARCIALTDCSGGEDEPDCDPEIASCN